MSKSYIKVNSVTHAIKAKEILSSNGFYAQVKRYDKLNRKDGCGYQVVVDGDVTRAEAILRNNHVKVLGHGEMSEPK